MVEIRLSAVDYDREGKLVFSSMGEIREITVSVDKYTKPYNFYVNIYDDYTNEVIRLDNYFCDYDDDNGYAVWCFNFDCGGNKTSEAYTGYINIIYEDSENFIETEIPYYVKYENEGEIHPFRYELKFNANTLPQIGYDRYVNVGYNNVSTLRESKIVGGSGWLNIDLIEDITGQGFVGYEQVMQYEFGIHPNTETTERTADVWFIITDTAGHLKKEIITITQAGVVTEPDTPDNSKEVTYAPFWQDTLYSFINGDEYEIYIEEAYRDVNQTFRQDKLIYKGKIYAAPDKTSEDVAINRICQNYINDAHFDFDDNTIIGASDIYKFKLKIYDKLVHTYYFVRDWSYKPLLLGVKTNPILPFIGTGQRCFFSAFATDRKLFPYGVEYYDGTEPYSNSMDIQNSIFTEIIVKSRTKGIDTFWFGRDDEYKKFQRLPLCKCKYVLYYLNPYGGWDWLTIVGRVTKKDKIEQYNYTKNYNNTKVDFGRYRYLSEIHTTYTMHTGWLTQAQSDRMWELLESNCVYLHNLEEDKIIPVVLTHSEVEYKQKTNRSRMIDYEIIAEESQTKERI